MKTYRSIFYFLVCTGTALWGKEPGVGSWRLPKFSSLANSFPSKNSLGNSRYTLNDLLWPSLGIAAITGMCVRYMKIKKKKMAAATRAQAQSQTVPPLTTPSASVPTNQAMPVPPLPTSVTESPFPQSQNNPSTINSEIPLHSYELYHRDTDYPGDVIQKNYRTSYRDKFPHTNLPAAPTYTAPHEQQQIPSSSSEGSSGSSSSISSTTSHLSAPHETQQQTSAPEEPNNTDEKKHRAAQKLIILQDIDPKRSEAYRAIITALEQNYQSIEHNKTHTAESWATQFYELSKTARSGQAIASGLGKNLLARINKNESVDATLPNLVAVSTHLCSFACDYYKQPISELSFSIQNEKLAHWLSTFAEKRKRDATHLTHLKDVTFWEIDVLEPQRISISNNGHKTKLTLPLPLGKRTIMFAEYKLNGRLYTFLKPENFSTAGSKYDFGGHALELGGSLGRRFTPSCFSYYATVLFGSNDDPFYKKERIPVALTTVFGKILTYAKLRINLPYEISTMYSICNEACKDNPAPLYVHLSPDSKNLFANFKIHLESLYSVSSLPHRIGNECNFSMEELIAD